MFEPPYRNPDCLRGIADFSHLWLIWEFDKVAGAGWSPTVLPPKLGGKTRVGVFATRSPFRPNPLGLSCVKLVRADLHTKDGPVLYVAGADLVGRRSMISNRIFRMRTAIPRPSTALTESATQSP